MTPKILLCVQQCDILYLTIFNLYELKIEILANNSGLDGLENYTKLFII